MKIVLGFFFKEVHFNLWSFALGLCLLTKQPFKLLKKQPSKLTVLEEKPKFPAKFNRRLVEHGLKIWLVNEGKIEVGKLCAQSMTRL